MSVQQLLLGAAGASGYNLDRSVRLRSSASGYLNRTPSVSGSRTTWTWSGWVKIGLISSNDNALFMALNNASGAYNVNDWSGVFLRAGSSFDFIVGNGGSVSGRLVTTQAFRDFSSWYHLVFTYDSTNATSTDRMRMYVNGSRVTAFSTATYPSINTNSYQNTTNSHFIGQSWLSGAPSNPFDGYLAEVNFIDGQALTSASFGETNALTGVWQPKAYTGTYGTNGFYLDFEDTSSVAALGTDSSGNGNTWTVNNISLTAGVTYDSMTDVPTLTSASASNYAVLNPLNSYAGLVQGGNLNAVNGSANWQMAVGSIYQSSGKWYAEMTCTNTPTNVIAGIVGDSINGLPSTYPGALTPSYGYNSNGNKYFNGSFAAYGATYTNGDVIGIALDLDAGTLTFYKNNVSQGSAATGLSGSFAFAFGCYQGSVAVNFGQRPFAFSPPTGYVALNAFNLP